MENKCWYMKPNRCIPQKIQGCDDEFYYCSKDSENYHKLCDRVWNITPEELAKMSVKDLEKLEDDASVCVYMRKRTEATCIHPQCRNSGHSGAIKKVQNKIRAIKHAKYQKSIDELFLKWLENPEDESIYDKYLTRQKIALVFPAIENSDPKNYFQKISKMNEIKSKVEHWGPEDTVFPNQWAVVAILPTGEEYVSFSDSLEEAYLEISTDLVSVFCRDKKYREEFFEKFGISGNYFIEEEESIVLTPNLSKSDPIPRKKPAKKVSDKNTAKTTAPLKSSKTPVAKKTPAKKSATPKSYTAKK